MGTILLFPVTGQGQGQQKPAPQASQQEPLDEEEAGYTEEEYDEYMKATQEPDLDKRLTMLAAFIEKYPKSKLMSYIDTAYQTLMFEHSKAQNWAKLQAAAELWLKSHPDDLQAKAYVAESAQKLGQDAKFLQYGQEIYAQKPTPGMAYYIMKTYEKTGDQAKFQEWAQKVMALPEFAGDVDLRMGFVKKHADAKNFGKAAEAALQALKSLDAAKKPESMPDLEWRKHTTAIRRVCYYLIGVSHYDSEKYNEAIKSLQQAVRAEKFGGGYYYIGLSQWKLGAVEEAILSFAKAVLLKGETQEPAQEHMEKLYKALHNNTTIGIDKVMRRADQELKGEAAAP
jgi:tetratricopeptide (TPR) repeat protein